MSALKLVSKIILFLEKLLFVSLLLLKSVVVNYEVTYQTQHIHADEGTKHKILDFESFGSVQEI